MAFLTNEFLQDGDVVEGSIVGSATGGNDTFTLALDSFAADLDVSLEASINLGGGDDLFELDLSDISDIDLLELAINGGSGNDRAVIDLTGVSNLETSITTKNGVFVSGSYSFDFTGGEGSISFRNIESFKVKGTLGNDTLFGGAGDDWLDGYVGADTLMGSDGNDSYVFGDAGDKVIGETTGGGKDTIWSTVSVNLNEQGSVENLRLWGSNDISATGNAQQNLITGNSGDNVITGGLSYDQLYGRGGADTFVYAEYGPGNRDLIVDFDSDDKIALSKHAFLGLEGVSKKALGADFFAVGAATADHAQIIYDADTGMVSYDVDGTGSTVASAIVRIEKNAAYFGHEDIIFV